METTKKHLTMHELIDKWFSVSENGKSKIFICRLCGTYYRLVKSIGKHWREKHQDETNTVLD